MRRRYGFGAMVCALALLSGVKAAQAQPAAPRVEVSAGYAWLNDATDEIKLPVGWDVGMAIGLTRWLSVAADAGGDYATLSLVGTDVSVRAYSLAAGPRVAARIGPFTEFAQLLAGADHGGGSAFGTTDAATHFMWQPGVGLDLPFGRHLSARGELDVRLLTDVHELRLVAGLVYRWRQQ